MAYQNRSKGIQRVLILTLIANLLVAAAKIAIGLLTSSLAMIADGFHSSLDSFSNIIGLVGSAIAAMPPDESHPYGHRRFETLASMAIGAFLLITGWEIVRSTISRLGGGEQPHITLMNFAVMIGTIITNVAVTMYESRAGKRLNSELLLADAAHTRSDVLVSVVVVASLIAVRLGLLWVDAVAALIVVGIIAYAGWGIVSRSAEILVDRAALEAERVRSIAQSVAGVQRVSRVRSRGPSDDILLDLDVEIAGPTTAEHSDAMAREMRTRLRKEFDGLSDIQVHFLPARDAPPDLALIIRAEADALGVGVHEIIPSEAGGELSLEMHVEVEPHQTVGEAHALVTEFERRLQSAIPHLRRVVTHIEPAHMPEHPAAPDGDLHALARRTLKIAEGLYPNNRWHDLDIRAEPDGGYAISMHCHVASDMRLEDAHRIAEVVETQVRAALPEVHRVTIHTEPPED